MPPWRGKWAAGRIQCKIADQPIIIPRRRPPTANHQFKMLGKLCRSENSGVAELKEDGQVSCDTAQNLRLLCSYITPHARAAARPHAGASTSLAFSSSFSV